MNQFLVIAAAEKIAAMETERFFEERRKRADCKAFRRILNRKGGEPPRPEDAMKSPPVSAARPNVPMRDR
jgi:hypothetical protein